MSHRIGILGMAAVISCLITVEAEAMRCDQRLVSRGDTAAEVLATCGNPAQVDQRVEYITQRISVGAATWIPGTNRYRFAEERVVPVSIEEWLFNFGPHRLMRLVHLEGGRVKSIATLGYGF